MRFNAYTSSCRVPSLCYVLAMNTHAARNPMGWYGRIPHRGVMINGHVARHLYGMAWQ